MNKRKAPAKRRTAVRERILEKERIDLLVDRQARNDPPGVHKNSSRKEHSDQQEEEDDGLRLEDGDP